MVAHGHGRRKRNKAKRVGLQRHEETRLKEQLRGYRDVSAAGEHPKVHRLPRTRRNPYQVPSEPWIDAQIWSGEDEAADGTRIVYRFHRTNVFPPGQELTGMVRCNVCGHHNPPNCTTSSGACLDCWYAGMSRAQLQGLPGTASTVNLARVKSAVRRGEQPTGGI
jgi:hypothetical protein